MSELTQKIENYGIVPVVKIEKIENALPLANALCSGGLPVAEITFRTACAEDAIKIISKNNSEMLVGAGTVLTTDQAKKARDAGAKFVVSPGFNPKVVSFCIDNNIPIFPGTNNPSFIEMGIEMGLKVLKFFPAEESGGVAFIKAVSAAYSGVKFIPTGGISKLNLNNYLSLESVVACGGSWMVKPELIVAGKFDEIELLTREALQIMHGYSFAHLGINESDETKANDTSNFFAKHFNFKVNDGASSIFTGQEGKEMEIMKSPYLGKNGHIAIGTNNINRSIFYLEQEGLKLNHASRKEKDGKLKAVYLENEIAGFAVHLVQK